MMKQKSPGKTPNRPVTTSSSQPSPFDIIEAQFILARVKQKMMKKKTPTAPATMPMPAKNRKRTVKGQAFDLEDVDKDVEPQKKKPKRIIIVYVPNPFASCLSTDHVV
jgi:hypothetical protein